MLVQRGIAIIPDGDMEWHEFIITKVEDDTDKFIATHVKELIEA